MSYTPAISAKDVVTAESRFLVFAGIATFGGVMLVVAMMLSQLAVFWEGHRLWSIGSYLIAASVTQVRFFDIKKNASPDLRHFNPCNRRAWIATAELIFNLLWIAGFAFVAVARWISL